MIIAYRIVRRRSHRPIWPVAAGMARRRIACRRARRVRYRSSPDRVPSGSSYAVSSVTGHGGEDGCRVRYRPSHVVSPVAGHGMKDGRRVPYRPSPDTASGMVVACRTQCVRDDLSPDRVRYGPSPDHVSSRLCPCRHPRCPCRGHGRESRRPVVCHVPAQQRL